MNDRVQLPADLTILILRGLIAGAIYLFLFWVAFVAQRSVLPRDDGARRAPGRLVVEAGPTGGPDPGVSIALQPRLSIGRAADNVIVVADMSVSNRHALVTLADDQWRIEDLRSTNGTTLNGRAVDEATPVAVGDEIQIGPARFRVES